MDKYLYKFSSQVEDKQATSPPAKYESLVAQLKIEVKNLTLCITKLAG